MSYAHADGYSIFSGDGPGHPEPDDRDVICVFKREARLNPQKSRAAGKKIYDNVDMAHLSVRTDHPRTVTVKRADKAMQQRFPREWAEHLARIDIEEPAEGTPLSMWAQIDPASLAMFRDMKIYTVEQVAESGGEGWSERARAWLDRDSEKDREIERLRAEVSLLQAGSRAASAAAGLTTAADTPAPSAQTYATALGVTPDGQREVIRTPVFAADTTAPRGRGRPPGSKNKPKE